MKEATVEMASKYSRAICYKTESAMGSFGKHFKERRTLLSATSMKIPSHPLCLSFILTETNGTADRQRLASAFGGAQTDVFPDPPTSDPSSGDVRDLNYTLYPWVISLAQNPFDVSGSWPSNVPLVNLLTISKKSGAPFAHRSVSVNDKGWQAAVWIRVWSLKMERLFHNSSAEFEIIIIVEV